MQLHLILPEKNHRFVLNETMIEHKSCYFYLESATFSLKMLEIDSDALCFSWKYPDLFVVNQSRNHECIIDDKILSPGEQYEMHNDYSNIHIGEYYLQIELRLTTKYEQVGLSPSPTMVTWPDERNIDDLPEIDALLPHAGYYSGYLEDAASLQTDGGEPDILKMLECEYKRYLVWGYQKRPLYSVFDDPNKQLLPEHNAYFERVVENVKDKTVTECILNDEKLIDKVLKELMSFNEIEVTEDDQVDILTVLAPENIAKRKQQIVSRLTFQELYSLGLESQI